MSFKIHLGAMMTSFREYVVLAPENAMAFFVRFILIVTFICGNNSLLQGFVESYEGEVPAIVLSTHAPVYCIQDYARFLSIKKGYLTADDAWQLKHEFLESEDFSITNDENEVWVYFSVENTSMEPQKFYVNGQLTDYVELYQIIEHTPTLVSSTGYLIPFDKRPILDWGLILEDEVPGATRQEYLFRLKSVTRNSRHLMNYSVVNCMKLYSKRRYESEYKLRRRLTYFFLGAIFIMFVYNMGISICTWYSEYFLFSIYNIVTVLTCLFISDAHLEVGLVPVWNGFRNVQYILLSIVPLCYCWFSIKYLDINTHMPLLFKAIKWMTWLYLLVFLTTILSFYVFSLILSSVMSGVFMLLIFSASIELSKKVVSARFLLLGNIIIIILGFIQVFSLLDWVTTSQMIISSFVLQMLEILIFSFAVAYKLKISKKAMHMMRNENIIQQEKLKMEEAMRKQLQIDNNQKSRSLMATSIQMLNFNDKLTNVIENIDPTNAESNKLIKELNKLRQFENQWNTIKVHFENVHPDFFEILEQCFPNLTSKDQRLLVFMKMKLSNKEIATISNVTIRAVEQSKRRIKKKLGMDTEDMDILGYIEEHVGTS